jgi:hypothetical protein
MCDLVEALVGQRVARRVTLQRRLDPPRDVGSEVQRTLSVLRTDLEVGAPYVDHERFHGVVSFGQWSADQTGSSCRRMLS